MPRPALKLVDGGLDTTVEWQWFCGYCAAPTPGNQPPPPSGRVCSSCGLGMLLETRADAVPSEHDAFVVVDSRMLVQAASREAQRLLAISEEDAIDTPVSELLISADAESTDRGGFAAAIAEAAQGLEPETARSFVRPWNTFGVRMRAKIAMCGPPRAALIVLGNDRPPSPRQRSSKVVPLRAIR
ncbi:MAG TPA: PAS domain-containing protein [Solirubrobacteraceae bacterium]|nr:PAS domain-containing protein [Solirubrobacteraceae bacterium]